MTDPAGMETVVGEIAVAALKPIPSPEGAA